MADRFAGQRAVVTGAASGIGRAFASALAARGAELVLCDLNLDALETLAVSLRDGGARVQTAQVDVADPVAMQAFADTTLAAGPVHLLINNAGIGLAGRIMDATVEDWRRVFDVNLMGVVHGCRAFLPAMIAHGQGAAVINLASASAFMGSPGLGVYSVSKHAVLAYSEVLDAELQQDPITVHCVCPGFVPTNILVDSHVTGDDPERARAGAQKLFPKGRDPAQVASAALRAVERGRFLVGVFPEAHGIRLVRSLPDLLARPIRRAFARRIQRLAER